MEPGAQLATPHRAIRFYRYLRVSGTEQLEHELEIAGHPDFLFFGHTHWPMNRRFGKAVVVNPGSVGQPKDGDARAAYAVWQNGEVQLRRAAYNVEETAQALAGTALDPADIAALSHVLRTGGELPL